jgi:hypothetical protein
MGRILAQLKYAVTICEIIVIFIASAMLPPSWVFPLHERGLA